MRTAVTLVLALAAVPAAAHAAVPLGVPTEMRVARPADARPHPSVQTEQWELLAMHPRTRRALIVRLRRAPDLGGVQVAVGGTREPVLAAEPAQEFERTRGPRVRFSGEGGTSTIDRRGGRFRLTLTGPEVSGRVTLHGGRPGPFARGWRIPQLFESDPKVMGLSWHVPVATSTLRGSLRIGGETLRFDGWRASLEHLWGSIDLGNLGWEYWDAYTVHDGRGRAWIATGLNRMDTVTGPGARDAQYLGVLARVTPAGVRMCRPRVHRREWVGGAYGFTRELRASCGGLRVRLAEVGEIGPDAVALPGGTVERVFEYRDHARANGRGFGFGRHRGHDLLR